RRMPLDAVDVHGGCLEHLGLALEHPVVASRLRERNTSAKAELTAAWIADHGAAGGGHAYLQSPATAEAWNSRLEHRFCQVDLPLDGDLARVHVQRRTGDHGTVVVSERHPVR